MTGYQIPDDAITQRLVSLYSSGATPRLLTGIAWVESSYRQFEIRTLYNRQDLWPLESYDGGSHIGLMQVVTDWGRAFDWMINTQDGVNLFTGDKMNFARTAERRLRQTYPQLRALTPVELENMALVLYGPYGDADDAVKGPVTRQYYTVNSDGTEWIVNSAGNPNGVQYADGVRSSVR